MISIQPAGNGLITISFICLVVIIFSGRAITTSFSISVTEGAVVTFLNHTDDISPSNALFISESSIAIISPPTWKESGPIYT